MGAGLGGLALLGSAVGAASDFATAIAKVQTIADEAAFPLSEIARIGHEMGAVYGGDLTTQIGALYSAIGSGAENVADATAVMHSANMLAIGGLTTTDVAMTGLMGTLNGFGLGLSKAGDVADSFFQAVKLGGSDLVVGTLTNALGRVVPTAAALGVQLDELTGSIARMTQVGIKTDEAVTGMKAILDQIIKPSSDATAEAAKLGIKFNMHAIKMAGGFQKFVETIVSNPKFNKDTLKKLFGSSSEALNAFLALSTDGGAKFGAVMQSMVNKTGIA
ncbi:MAG: phage tail tape measure protein, partial [Bdellovibrionota bacterium]